MGIFICLYEPTSGMVKMAKEMGTYKNKLFNLEYPKLQIVSIKDYFDMPAIVEDTPGAKAEFNLVRSLIEQI